MTIDNPASADSADSAVHEPVSPDGMRWHEPSEPEHLQGPSRPPRGEFLWVDPRTLVIEENVRLDEDLDPEFLDSVAEHGVLQAINVRRRVSDDALVVRMGMRRTLAAIRAERWLWALVEQEPAPETGSDPEEQVRRIVDQLTENRHRRGNTDPDEVGAHQLLIGYGLTAEQIAATTHTDAARVRRTTAVGRSAAARRALEDGGIDLVQLAVIAEFDGDADAVAQLEHAARTTPAQFDHLVERLRQSRERSEAYQNRVTELSDAGTTVLDPSDHSGAAALHTLRGRAEDPPGSTLTEGDHIGCPGHAVQVQVYMRGGGAGIAVEETPWCLNPDQYGHVTRWASPPAAGSTDTDPGSTDSGGQTDPVDLDADPANGYQARSEDAYTAGAQGDGDGATEADTEFDTEADPEADSDADAEYDADAARVAEEQAAERRAADELAAEQRAAAQRAAERARRRAAAEQDFLLALRRNRTAAVEAAAVVRRDWLGKQLLTRKVAPKDATRYIARVLCTGLPYPGLDDLAADGHPIACELLGVGVPEFADDADDSDDAPVSQGLLAAVRSANAGRATVLTLALVLAAQEAGVPSTAWSSPHPETAGYLRQLREWKYPLSPIEELMVAPDADARLDGDPDPLPEEEDGDSDRGADPGTGGEAFGEEAVRASAGSDEDVTSIQTSDGEWAHGDEQDGEDEEVGGHDPDGARVVAVPPGAPDTVVDGGKTSGETDGEPEVGSHGVAA